MDFYCNAMEKGSSDASLIGLSKTPNEQLKVLLENTLLKIPSLFSFVMYMTLIGIYYMIQGKNIVWKTLQ